MSWDEVVDVVVVGSGGGALTAALSIRISLSGNRPTVYRSLVMLYSAKV